MRPAIAILFMLLFTGAAQAAPVIVSLDVEGVAVAGEPVTIDLVARDPQLPVTAASGPGFAESACRITSDGADDATGAFAPDRAARFELPLEAASAGISLVEVTAASGGCSGASATVTKAFSLTVTLPPVLPLPRAKGAAAPCAGADATPKTGNGKLIREAVLCLLNAERAKSGRDPLREDRRLRKAAARHSRDMVRRHFFDHVGPSGPSLAERVKRAHYWPARVGENIGYGGGSFGTPAGMVDAWMNSDGHRANILARNYGRVGVGVVKGEPAGSGGATYTADFGDRG
jgi:uncharacterized protein YkwD